MVQNLLKNRNFNKKVLVKNRNLFSSKLIPVKNPNFHQKFFYLLKNGNDGETLKY